MDVNKLIDKYARCIRIQEDEIEESEPFGFGEGYAKGKIRVCKRVLKDLEQLSTIEYSHKEKLPRVLASFVEELKNTNKRYGIFLEETFQNTKDSDLANYLSMNENIEKVFKAISNGYEVEEEPKYYVKVGEKLYFKSWGEDGQSPEFIIDCHFYSKQGAYVCDSKEVAQKIASEVGGTVEKEGTK